MMERYLTLKPGNLLLLVLYITMGTFFIAVFSNFSNILSDSSLLAILVLITYAIVFIGIMLTIDFYGKIMDHQTDCRDKIYVIKFDYMGIFERYRYD